MSQWKYAVSGNRALIVKENGETVVSISNRTHDSKFEGRVRFICRAVNAHKLLIDTLEIAEMEITEMLEDFCQSEGPKADSSAQATLAMIRAAIKQAEAS